MKFISRIIPWKVNIILTSLILLLLFVCSFYGLYTNRFYFFKPDNYIFPILTLVHFTFLYVLWFKVKAGEAADPIMRNLEYALYVIVFVYVFKVFDNVSILLSYNEMEGYVIPETFIPMATGIVALHVILVFLTLVSFKQRQQIIGKYHFEDANTGFDTW